MEQGTEAISDFWLLFRERAADLAVATSAEDSVYDVLLAQLHGINRGLFLEFSANRGACELIVTADGDRSLFPLVRTMVAAAPAVEGWNIRALKPQLGFPETVRWEKVELRIADIVFDPLERQGRDDLGLRIFVPGLAEKDTEEAHNAILRAMDHGLGEERLAEAVQYTEVRPLPAEAAAEEFIPLLELDSYLQWRENRRKEGAG